MGWMFVHKERNESVLDFFKRELEYEDENNKLTILRKSGKYYAAEVIHKNKNNERIVFGMVILTKNCRNDYHNFGYKVVEETSGPVHNKCPESILRLLTPTDSEWANEWRENSHNYNVNKKSKRQSMKKDSVIKLRHPVWIEFGNIDTFRKVHSRKLLFKPVRYDENTNEYKDYNCFPYRIERGMLDGCEILK